jgi:hypothetical protein
MRLPPRDASSPVAVASLVGANLVPLVGVAWLGWRSLDVLALYWLENGVIGALNVPKMLLAAWHAGDPTDATTLTDHIPIDLTVLRPVIGVLSVGFFLFHYGLFWIGHGAFVLVGLPRFLDSVSWTLDASFPAIRLGVGALLVSHCVSFVENYIRSEEYRNVTLDRQMKRPYNRVLVLHATIVLGAFAIDAMGTPVAMLGLLVVLKTVLDLWTHLRDHA